MVQIAIVVTNKLCAAAISFRTNDILIDLNELSYAIEPNIYLLTKLAYGIKLYAS